MAWDNSSFSNKITCGVLEVADNGKHDANLKANFHPMQAANFEDCNALGF